MTAQYFGYILNGLGKRIVIDFKYMKVIIMPA